MPEQMSLANISICVLDLELSTQFYKNALGFTPTISADAGPEVSDLTELEGTEAVAQFLVNQDGLAVELVQFISPSGVGDRSRCPVNRYGITHLTFQVENLDAAMKAVEEHGGQAHRHIAYETEYNDGEMDLIVNLVVCTDPDGTRIQLCERTPV